MTTALASHEPPQFPPLGENVAVTREEGQGMEQELRELQKDVHRLTDCYLDLKGNYHELKADNLVIHGKLTRLEGEVNGLRSEIKEVKEDVKEIKDQLKGLEASDNKIREEIREEVKALTASDNAIRADIYSLKEEMLVLRQDMFRLEQRLNEKMNHHFQWTIGIIFAAAALGTALFTHWFNKIYALLTKVP